MGKPEGSPQGARRSNPSFPGRGVATVVLGSDGLGIDGARAGAGLTLISRSSLHRSLSFPSPVSRLRRFLTIERTFLSQLYLHHEDSSYEGLPQTFGGGSPITYPPPEMFPPFVNHAFSRHVLSLLPYWHILSLPYCLPGACRQASSPPQKSLVFSRWEIILENLSSFVVAPPLPHPTRTSEPL